MRQGFNEKKISTRIAPSVIMNRGVDPASVCVLCEVFYTCCVLVCVVRQSILVRVCSMLVKAFCLMNTHGQGVLLLQINMRGYLSG
jgi:hypothetical protein